ncbi:hypothetical protein [Actinoplanes couchii]|uniref:Uncharacterized protein n=1 Tax=Actinoplanes couchii TaxID=403638 RepID=A0ABQ3XP11_9ACTN|nr:hypothetical protein [Actinoplanes couchii]MDR6318643.1 hypothetical protein [Actinoplanes couchii]GID60251.1 hypothetical protein Aco03nite_086550 [Actinoplanes couchii]
MASSTAVAVRSDLVRTVADALVGFAAAHGVRARVLSSVPSGAKLTAFVGKPSGEAALVRQARAGDPEAVAAAFGADPRMVARYYVSPGWLARRSLLARLPGSSFLPRAFPDDKVDLLDGWVGVDLWRRLGITYDPPDWAHAGGFDTVETPPFPRD